MSDIVEFLTDRLDEDEAAAKVATPGPWTTDDPLMSDFVGSTVLKDYVATCSVRSDYRENSIQDAAHIARHDPARVLAEVKAKREIVKFCDDDPLFLDGGWAYTDRVLRLLASAYDQHPDYDPAWRVQ